MNGAALAIYGSPRVSGFSSALHDALLSPFYSEGALVSEFRAYGKKTLPCNACSFCREESRCVHEDDMSLLYASLCSCEVLTVSAPVYFSALGSVLKGVVDRCQFVWHHKEFAAPKKGLFIAAAGSAYADSFTGALISIKHFFNTLNASFNEDDFILLSGTDNMICVPDEMLQRAKSIGEKYLRMAYK